MKIDHIALVVENPKEAAHWYSEKFGANIIHADDTWSFIEFENVKMAFVVKSQHPAHVAFEDPGLEGGKLHRDGTTSVYKRDPFGNYIEFIKYPKPL